MNIEFAKALISQKHKSWSQVGEGIQGAVGSSLCMEAYYRSMGLPGGNAMVVARIAAGSFWAPGIFEAVTDVYRSCTTLKASMMHLNWCCKFAPSSPVAAKARGEIKNIDKNLAALDRKHLAAMTAKIPAGNARNAIKGIWPKLDIATIQRWSQSGSNPATQAELGFRLGGLFGLTPLQVVDALDGLKDAGTEISAYLGAREALESAKRSHTALAATGVSHISSSAVTGGMRSQISWSLVYSVWTLATVAFTAMSLIFTMSRTAVTGEEFAQMQWGKSFTEVSGLCAASQAAELSGKVVAWQSLVGLGRLGVQGIVGWIPAVVVVLQASTDMSKGWYHGLNSLARNAPFYAFTLGWYGIVPIAIANMALMTPLVAICAYQVLWKRQVGIVKPDGTPGTPLDIMADPSAAHGGALGTVLKYGVGHWMPLVAWKYQADRLARGVDIAGSIVEQGLDCAIFNQLTLKPPAITP